MVRTTIMLAAIVLLAVRSDAMDEGVGPAADSAHQTTHTEYNSHHSNFDYGDPVTKPPTHKPTAHPTSKPKHVQPKATDKNKKAQKAAAQSKKKKIAMFAVAGLVVLGVGE
jgi:hypothetical protein